MIPSLYPEGAKYFGDNYPPIGYLHDCISFEVTEERNGMFECEFEYPITGPLFSQIKPGCIVYATYDISNTPEPFDIYSFSIDINGIATYRAHHISYRLNNIVYMPDISGARIFGYMGSNAALWRLPDKLTDQTYWYTHANKLPNGISFDVRAVHYNMDVTSPDYDDTYYSIDINQSGLREVLIGTTSSVVTQGNAEFKWYYTGTTIHVDMMRYRGADTPSIIRIGKDVSGVKYEYDISDKCDEIIPYVNTSNGIKTMKNLTNEAGESVSYISVPSRYKMDDRFNAMLLDVTDNLSSADNAKAEDLEKVAREYYASHNIENAYENLSFSFVPIWQTSEYEYIAPAEKLKLCDTASIVWPELGIYKRMKVVRTVWNPLLERYNEMEFGSYHRTIFTVDNRKNTAIEIEDSRVNVEQEVYGVSWDKSSSTVLTRTDLAASFSNPSPAVANGTGSSPFDDIYPWSGIRRVTINGNEMVSIPKFYYKWTNKSDSLNLQISPVPKKGYHISPAHANRGDGKGERDMVYVGRYHCSSNYKSVTNVMPINDITRATARAGCKALGTGYYQLDYAMIWTIRMLYLVEYADWDSQKVIGYGCSPSRAVFSMGYTDSMQYHTGTDRANRTTYGGTQYRYIEGLWDNVMDWCDGIVLSSDVPYVTNIPADYGDSTTNHIKVGPGLNSSGTISGWHIPSAYGLEWALVPSSVVSGISRTYITDYYNGGRTTVINPTVGGAFYNEFTKGMFSLVNSFNTDYHEDQIGARLQYLP